jgi:hypothetical protein
MTSGALVLRRSVCSSQLRLSGCSSWFSVVLDTEVNDAQDDSWRGSFATWFYLAAKPSHAGGRCGWASLSSAPAYGS